MNTILKEHYESCLKKHGANYRGMDWPNPQDAEKRYEVMLDILKSNDSTFLDIGCGVGLLFNYLRKTPQYKLLTANYSGIDISPAMIEGALKVFPRDDFRVWDCLENSLPEDRFDYVIMNGVLTVKASNTQEEMWEFAKQMIKAAYKTAKIGIAFNVMSKHVDWERDDLFHVGFDEMVEFLSKEVSRHFVFRADYGLYEYTVYCYKECQ